MGGSTSVVRLRSPWVVVWWGLAAVWGLVGLVMVPTRADGAWVTVDGSPADPVGAAVGLMCLALGVSFCVFAPSVVRVDRDQGFVRCRRGFKRQGIDLREVTAVDVIPRPGAVLDAVQPVLRLIDDDEPLTGLAGYPGSGGRNRRVDRQVEVLRNAWEQAQRAAGAGRLPDSAGE